MTLTNCAFEKSVEHEKNYTIGVVISVTQSFRIAEQCRYDLNLQNSALVKRARYDKSIFTIIEYIPLCNPILLLCLTL